jgi:hypothetical protein
MPDIILPGGRDASSGHPSARPDPNAGAQAGVPDEVRLEQRRQQRLQDATEGARIREGVTIALREGLSRRAAEADFADDAVRGEYNIFVGNAVVDSRREYRTATGAARLSDEATARLDRTLDDIGQLFIDQSDSLHLRSMEQRGLDQLTTLTDQAVKQARSDVTAAPDDDPAMLLSIHLEMFDDTVTGFQGAFKGNKQHQIRTTGRVKIIEEFVGGMAEAGRGGEAQALLENEEIAGSLDDVTLARLKRNARALTEAYDQDRATRAQRETEAAARENETAALTFSTDFRSRLEGGDATLAEIAAAHNEGVLTAAQADRLRADFTAAQKRRSEASARAERVSSELQTGNRLDPEDFDDQDDVAHHYAATLKPSLIDLGPAQKASAIRGYVDDIGIAPDAAIKSLLGLTVAGDAPNRIAAARELTKILLIDVTARDRVPPALAAYAEATVQLADTDAIAPEEVVNAADAMLSKFAEITDSGVEYPHSALIQLASAHTKGTVQTDGRFDTQPATGLRRNVSPDPDTDNRDVRFIADDDNDQPNLNTGKHGTFSGLQSLLDRINKGEPADRVAAARELVSLSDNDPAILENQPPELAVRAELLADLADIDPRTPDKIIRDIEALLSEANASSGQNPSAPPSAVMTDATGDPVEPGQQLAQRGGRRGGPILVRPPSGPPRETPRRALNSHAAQRAKLRGTIRGWVRDYQVPRITVQTSEQYSSSSAAWLVGFRQLLKASNGGVPVRIEPNKYRSQDGRWQMRLDQAREKSHFNLERIDPVSGFVIRNTHLRFSE